MKNTLLFVLLAIAVMSCKPGDYDAMKKEQAEHQEKHAKQEALIEKLKAAAISTKLEENMAVYADDVVWVGGDGMEIKGKAGVTGMIDSYYKSSPDLKCDVVMMSYCEPNMVVSELRYTGTFKNAMNMGKAVMKPNNKKFDFKMAVLQKINDAGLIVEEHAYYDNAYLMSQMTAK